MAGLTVDSVVAGVLAALVVGATVRGWRLVWQVSGRWPDLRGDWTAEGSRDSGAVDVEEVHIDRQLGRRFRGKLTCVVNGAKLELDLRGRFYDLETLTYEHRYRAPGQASQIGVGLLQLSRLRDSATGKSLYLGTSTSAEDGASTSDDLREPTVFHMSLTRGCQPPQRRDADSAAGASRR